MRDHWPIVFGILFLAIVVGLVRPWEKPKDIQLLETERNAYRDSLAIVKHEKQVLMQQLDTLQKIKIDEIRSVDSLHVDSLLLYIANFPTAQP